MPDITVVAPPPIGRVANVELVHTGFWEASTGPVTFTPEDLAAAVAAIDCPAVRRPILKLGHVPDPMPGQPAVGFIANMATAENGHILVGDYVGMPGWLVTANADGDSVLSSAYPDRSIEGDFDHRCQLGHIHPFVITAVSLLGEERPGVGTLQSLQDLADLYGVAAAGPDTAGRTVTITVRAAQEARMPAPATAQVAAGVTTEDVRRAFYSTPAGAGWDIWIEEMQLTPEQQLIVVDDGAGTRSRIPIVIGDGDGETAVSFGTAVPVVIRYEDAPVAAAARPATIRFASREESRPGGSPTPPAQPPEAPAQTGASSRAETAGEAMRRVAAAPQTTAAGQPAVAASQEGAGMDPAKIREALGLQPDASDDEVRTAFAASALAPSTTPEPAPAGDGTPTPPAPPAPQAPATAGTSDAVILDPAQYAALRAQAMRGDEAWRKMREAESEQILDAAIKAGKFPPARRDHWKTLWAADPDGTKATIEKLASNVIPVLASGFPGVGDEAETDIVYAAMYPEAAKAGGRRG